MNRSVLFGNGINIEFSGTDEYKNYAIIQRMCDNLNESGRYVEVFANTIDASDMHDFLTNLNNWFIKYALKGFEGIKLTQNRNELQALIEMAYRYKNTKSDVLSVGLEDYLLALKLFNESFGEEALDYQTLYQGITCLMSDAIYNDSKIETIYRNMFPYQKELNSFDKIFTVNYDSNLDKITDKIVYHLHGSFQNLHHEYRADSFKGWVIKKTGKELHSYIKGKEYLYSDALFGFSGEDKAKRIAEYNFPYINPALEKIRNQHPELIYPAYPIEEFKNISGELYIIGLGPHNDSHIFEMINNNDKLTKVIYYSACESDTNKVKKIIDKPLIINDVFEYWNQVK